MVRAVRIALDALFRGLWLAFDGLWLLATWTIGRPILFIVYLVHFVLSLAVRGVRAVVGWMQSPLVWSLLLLVVGSFVLERLIADGVIPIVPARAPARSVPGPWTRRWRSAVSECNVF